MKGQKFAKIFETKNGQVLVTKGYDTETERHHLNYQMWMDGLQISTKVEAKTLGDKGRQQIDKLFKFTEEPNAFAVSKMIINMLTEE